MKSLFCFLIYRLDRIFFYVNKKREREKKALRESNTSRHNNNNNERIYYCINYYIHEMEVLKQLVGVLCTASRPFHIVIRTGVGIILLYHIDNTSSETFCAQLSD